MDVKNLPESSYAMVDAVSLLSEVKSVEDLSEAKRMQSVFEERYSVFMDLAKGALNCPVDANLCGYSSAYSLPRVRDESDAIAVAKVFRRIFIFEDPVLSPFRAEYGEAAESLLVTILLVLSDYWPRELYSFESFFKLIETFDPLQYTSTFDYLFGEIETGMKGVLPARLRTGYAKGSGLSSLVRGSDGKRPCDVDKSGRRGFNASDDPSLKSYYKFRSFGSEDRIASYRELMAVCKRFRPIEVKEFSNNDTRAANGERLFIAGNQRAGDCLWQVFEVALADAYRRTLNDQKMPVGVRKRSELLYELSVEDMRAALLNELDKSSSQ